MVIRPIVPILEYAINYEYISKVLCENKNNPKKKCNGKCHLKKELNDVFNTEKSPNSNNSGKTNAQAETVIIFLSSLPVFDLYHSTELQPKKYNPNFQDFHKDDFIKDIFHPPTFIV